MKWLLQNKYMAILLAAVVALSVGIFQIDTSDNFYIHGNGTVEQAPPGASLFFASEYRVYILTAGGGWAPEDVSGAAPAQVEVDDTDNKDLYLADFDATTKEYLLWSAWTPPTFGGRTTSYTITARFVWTVAQTASAGSDDVVWGFQVGSYDDGDALSTDVGTAQEVTDDCDSAVHAAYDVLISSATSAITISNTPGAGDFLIFQAYRDPDNGSDNYGYDARLIAVIVTFMGR